MKYSWLEIVSYIVAILVVIGIFYYVLMYKEASEKSKLEKGEIVEGEKEIKQEIIKEADVIQDELTKIEGLI